MASIQSGYEYDIFISYRQKDNKLDGWVTTFVANLKKELEAAFKEDISVYFDQNPTDGILETHHVDATVSAKIKCLVFIPILSQTYCDARGFAWSQEFKAFLAFAKADRFGLNVKLPNGNMASRVLPIRIHDLDSADKQLVEAELGGVLRAIDFIYRSAGVVRTLQQNEEDPKANLDHTFYRDQMSKVVRGIKDLITGMQMPVAAEVKQGRSQQESVPRQTRKRISWIASGLILISIVAFGAFYLGGFKEKLNLTVDKSIAVIPFTNMNNDPQQDYLSDGMAEDILNHLVKIEDLKVKSRTSTLQYKNTKKNIREIGEELGVGTILEGSVRKAGDKIRIVVQLIDVNTDNHIWSETYDRDMKDVLSMQSEIALEIANVLKARLSEKEKLNITQTGTKNSLGYEYFLQARQLAYSTNTTKTNYLGAMELANKAIKLDPNLARAYALKGQLWFLQSSLGIPLNMWRDSAIYYATRAITIDSQQPEGYVVRGNVLQVLGKRNESRSDFLRAYEVAPNNSDVLNALGNQYLIDGNKKGADMILRAIEQNNSRTDPNYFLSWFNVFLNMGDAKVARYFVEKLREVDPGSGILYWNSGWMHRDQGHFEESIKEAEMGRKLNPDAYFMIDNLGWAYYSAGQYEKAEATFSLGREFEKKMDDTTQHVPFRHRLGMVKLKLGKKQEAEELFREELQVDQEQIAGKRGFGVWGGNGSAYFDMAGASAMLGEKELAIQFLDSAFSQDFGWYNGYKFDPLFEPLHQMPGYRKVLDKVALELKFRQEAFQEAFNKYEASQSMKSLLDK